MPDSTATNNFEKLLAAFSGDRDEAGVRYEMLRRKLMRFFEWRGCDACEDLADVVFDRVLRKISEGEEVLNPDAFAATVARFVLLEVRRDPKRFSESIDDHPSIADRPAPTFEDADDRRHACLDRCLAKFDSETRRLLVAYHDTDERTMIPTRKRLAEQLGISLNTLRIRVCRQKSKLESCVVECAGESPKKGRP